MRSELEVRREVEARLKRRALLLLHGCLWAVISLSLYLYARYWGIPPGWESMPTGWTTSAAMTMAIWLLIVGLHTFWVIYVEVRERMVLGAIERERQSYSIRDKRKRSEPDAFHISDDGEVDFIQEREENAPRKRNS